MEMATTNLVIDPRGDILLYFPGRHQQQQDAALADPTQRQPETEGDQMSLELSSPQTVCGSLTHHTIDGFAHFASTSSSSSSNLSSPSGAVSLQVSSSVLCLASPVFSAMLSSPMAEGQGFRAAGSPRPFPITLPEDDGHVFAILANVLHFRPDNVPWLPATSTLLALALLVDKYVCVPALRCHGEIWLNRAAEAPRDNAPEFPAFFESRYDLLLFAYVLDLPASFFQLSWDVVLNHRQQLKQETEYGLDLPIPKDHELLRHDLHSEIAKRKARLRREVHNALMEPVSRVTSLLVNYGGADGKPPCPNAAFAIGNYMAFLDFNNLSPWRAQYETDSFSSIIKRALEAAELSKDNAALRFEACSRTRCSCDAMAYGDAVDMARILARSLAGALNWKLGACLDCLKNGREYRGTEACRLEHW
ncbi:hypothetical protein B0T16DRAFT_181095 [Cercophora newfieldiana]|uniref:BTB domain-containing protein n=1 Tax=Cercophora newfieldiana TaxID=92897 RepID=A0AA40CM16_9PEZI|nr:hypothetical protein B0T16DRAFT_181095 [Cercophora newfieldiana]